MDTVIITDGSFTLITGEIDIVDDTSGNLVVDDATSDDLTNG